MHYQNLLIVYHGRRCMRTHGNNEYSYDLKNADQRKYIGIILVVVLDRFRGKEYCQHKDQIVNNRYTDQDVVVIRSYI